MGAAVGKGFATGLTFGLAGSEVVDGYEMSVSYTPVGGSPMCRKYKHAIHTTIGALKAPSGMQPAPLADAFDQVVEDMLLNFLRDFQQQVAVRGLRDSPSREMASSKGQREAPEHQAFLLRNSALSSKAENGLRKTLKDP